MLADGLGIIFICVFVYLQAALENSAEKNDTFRENVKRKIKKSAYVRYDNSIR